MKYGIIELKRQKRKGTDMEIKIFNTLTKKSELFVPIHPKKVTMYVCGPTVYNYIHIGNARPVVFFDVVRRFFEHAGYKVTYISNFTDIDDRIIEQAMKENKREEEISEKYIAAFLESVEKLQCIPYEKNPKVTENIENIVGFIEKLIDLQSAYVVDGDVYFRVSKSKDYGVLSGQTTENLEDGARIDVNEAKEDPKDFTLWKKTTQGRAWDSPWSKGRPGWHTECVVMVQDFFKEKIDIHGGGTELRFPHHENEIAQSNIVYGHRLANVWMHNNRVDLAGVKMSKSLGNVVWLKDILEKVSPKAFRFYMLTSHYRLPILYKEELLMQAVSEYEKMERTYVNLFRRLEASGALVLNEQKSSLIDGFNQEMADDFNTPNAITVLYEAIKEANKELRNPNADIKNLLILKNAIDVMFGVFGIEVDIHELNENEKSLIDRWQQARKNKDFITADRLREEIAARGVKW